VLAIGGARETVFYITPPLMKGMGRAGLNLRYELCAFAVQVGGIVIGLQFGLLGVAVGLVGAGFLLVPVLLAIQKRLCGIGIRTQLGNIWPPLHASLWAAAAYLGLAALPAAPPAGPPRLALGCGAFLVVLAAVLLLAHRRRLLDALSAVRSFGGGRTEAPTGRQARTGPATSGPPIPGGTSVPADTSDPDQSRAARSLP